MKIDEITIVVNAPVEAVREWLTAHMTRDWFHDGYYGRVENDTFTIAYHAYSFFSGATATFYGNLETQDGKTTVSCACWLRSLVVIETIVMVLFALIVVGSTHAIWEGLLVLVFCALCLLLQHLIFRIMSMKSRQKVRELLTQLEEEFAVQREEV